MYPFVGIITGVLIFAAVMFLMAFVSNWLGLGENAELAATHIPAVLVGMVGGVYSAYRYCKNHEPHLLREWEKPPKRQTRPPNPARSPAPAVTPTPTPAETDRMIVDSVRNEANILGVACAGGRFAGGSLPTDFAAALADLGHALDQAALAECRPDAPSALAGCAGASVKSVTKTKDGVDVIIIADYPPIAADIDRRVSAGWLSVLNGIADGAAPAAERLQRNLRAGEQITLRLGLRAGVVVKAGE